MPHPDVAIAGAGVIGLSLALELTRGGARVILLDRGPALGEASIAAAGMLAANDPHNPPPLQPLADLSLALYPAYLDHIAALSDRRVPFQTGFTLQATPVPTVDTLTRSDLDIFLPSQNLSGLHLSALDEHSIDPRELAPALLAAAANTSVQLLTDTPVLRVGSSGSAVEITTAADHISAGTFVDCTGAWSATLPEAVTPRKGQMLSVALPQSFQLSFVLRTPDIYVVPRTTGPSAGRALIGATVEDAGFDKVVHPDDIDRLHHQATQLLPALASAPILERWAGLRPATADELPLLGADPASPRHLFATGHFRNGILLAPASAHLVAQLILGDTPSIDLAPFSPARFPTHVQASR